MIDISLWRAVIGSWIFTRAITKEKGTYTKMDLAMDTGMSYGYLKFMYIMYCFLCIPYELNPGPT